MPLDTSQFAYDVSHVILPPPCIDILPLHGIELDNLVESYSTLERTKLLEPPRLRRYSKKLCSQCKKESVQWASFYKCPSCTQGSDAQHDWAEFCANAKYQPAHISQERLIYHVYMSYLKRGLVSP